MKGGGGEVNKANSNYFTVSTILKETSVGVKQRLSLILSLFLPLCFLRKSASLHCSRVPRRACGAIVVLTLAVKWWFVCHAVLFFLVLHDPCVSLSVFTARISYNAVLGNKRGAPTYRYRVHRL